MLSLAPGPPAASALKPQGWHRIGALPATVPDLAWTWLDRTPLSATASPTVGPPLLIPMYFQYQIIMTMIVRKDWVVSHAAWLARECGEGGSWGERPPGPLHCASVYLCGAPGISRRGGCLVPLRKATSQL